MPNIAVVVLDTLRKDAFDRHFDWLPGKRFENAWSTSHWTVPAHASLFTGKYASEVGTHNKSIHFDYEGAVLPEVLQADGYRTRAFCANPFLYTTGFDRGFEDFELGGIAQLAHEDVFDWNGEMEDLADLGPLRHPIGIAKCLLDSSDTVPSLRAGWWKKMKAHDGAPTGSEQLKMWDFGTNEFLFINLMEAHAPYKPPKPYQSVEPSTEMPQTILEGDIDLSDDKRAYDDAVRYLSDVYQGIFEILQTEFDYVFTLSDHGELFGEHGARRHHHGVYPELTHVPLVVSGSDLNGTSKAVTSTIDVSETIAEITGLDIGSRGHDLRKDIPSRKCLTEYHGFRESRKETFRDRGFSDAEINKHDQQLRGIVASPSYYGYQTVDGYRERGTASLADPQAELKKAIADLDSIKATDGSDLNVGDNVKNTLSDLGYI